MSTLHAAAEAVALFAASPATEAPVEGANLTQIAERAPARRRSIQRTRKTAVNIVAARYVDTYFRLVPIKLVTGQIDFANASLISVGINRVVAPRFGILGIRNNSFELEGQIVKHVRGQQHVEGTAAAVLRSGEIGLVRGSSLNLAFAQGLSYATRKPAFEYGPGFRGAAGGIRGDGAVKFQFYLGLEIELTPAPQSRIHFLGKLHHRSGGYGLISPQRTGSNYLGIGLRYDLAHQR